MDAPRNFDGLIAAVRTVAAMTRSLASCRAAAQAQPVRSTIRFRKSAAVAAILAVMLPASAPGCGFDAQIGGGVSIAHPASVPVAMAVGDAMSAGRLSPLVEVPPPLALMRANGAMQTFAAVLKPGVGTLPPVALVLIEAHLWGRITSESAGMRFEPHVAGPAAGDVIVVTAEPALKALLDGRMTWAVALASGLVVVDGPSEGRAQLARFLSQQDS